MTMCLVRILEPPIHPTLILAKPCFVVSITNYITVLPQEHRLMTSLYHLIRTVFNLSGRNGIIGDRTAVAGHMERI